MDPIVIVGTGLAGYQVAKEFRKLDTTSPLILITADEGRFYSKPLLSTALTQKKNFDTLTTSTAEVMEKQLQAKILTHTQVDGIIPEQHTLKANGKLIPYSKLILACGAHVIQPNLKGDGIDQVLSINHIYAYRDFQNLITNKKNITILGAGLIGCEFANDLSNAGYEVQVVALGKHPLDLLVPAEIGAILKDALEKNSVKFYFQDTVTQVNNKDEKLQLTLASGNTLQTEFVLSAIGLKPNIKIVESTEIKTSRGILVNKYLETSEPDIYALGDCAEVEGHVLPFITPLLNASRALAKTLAGEKTIVDYPAMPVSVKTPAHPIVVCPPPRNIKGSWQIEINDNNARALFLNEENKLYGFVLTNQATKERVELVKQMPKLF